jgi:hypothetical protein
MEVSSKHTSLSKNFEGLSYAFSNWHFLNTIIFFLIAINLSFFLEVFVFI